MDLQARCRGIDLLLLDVDGVLTDGSIIYGDRGEEVKAFHVRDGSGLKLWTKLGKRAGIITGRKSAIVERRAAELGLAPVVQEADDKLVAFEQVLRDQNLPPERACFVGDDLPDLPVLRKCGLAVAVADACPETKACAHFVTQTAGGKGAVREVIELLLRAQGRWQEIADRFSGTGT